MFMKQSTADHLASLGVTVHEARAFIAAHLDNPHKIANAADQHGITDEMLAQIVGGEITGLEVAAFFSAHGMERSGHGQIPALAENPPDVAHLVGLQHHADHDSGLG
jgi:hypothetical protein